MWKLNNQIDLNLSSSLSIRFLISSLLMACTSVTSLTVFLSFYSSMVFWYSFSLYSRSSRIGSWTSSWPLSSKPNFSLLAAYSRYFCLVDSFFLFCSSSSPSSSASILNLFSSKAFFKASLASFLSSLVRPYNFLMIDSLLYGFFLIVVFSDGALLDSQKISLSISITLT
jgi:hypothetical protein